MGFRARDALLGDPMAFTAGWDTAIVTDAGEFGAVKPVRLALDLARAARQAEAETN